MFWRGLSILLPPHSNSTMLGLQVAAIIVYIICGLFSNSFVTNYVIVVVLLMLDFWTVSSSSMFSTLQACQARARPLLTTRGKMVMVQLDRGNPMSAGVQSQADSIYRKQVCDSTCLAQTKNVAGRLLVGLRWWNEVTDEGSNWRFETLEEVMSSPSCRSSSDYPLPMSGRLDMTCADTAFLSMKIWRCCCLSCKRY